MGFMSGPWQKERVLSRLRLNGASGVGQQPELANELTPC
jgi:hypothetical protein